MRFRFPPASSKALSEHGKEFSQQSQDGVVKTGVTLCQSLKNKSKENMHFVLIF